MNGMKTEKLEKTENFHPKVCHRCEKTNPPGGKFCLCCGAPLDFDAVLKVEEKRKEVDGIMTTLLKDPEVLNLLVSKMKQMNLSFDARQSIR